MGRWDDKFSGGGSSWGGRGGGTRRIRIAKRVIIIGIIIVVAVVLTVFLSRTGLNVEITQREEGMGTLKTISIKISNNNFNSLNDVTVQFGQGGRIQTIGDMGPFSSAMITPETNAMGFDKVIVKANNGQIEVVKQR